MGMRYVDELMAMQILIGLPHLCCWVVFVCFDMVASQEREILRPEAAWLFRGLNPTATAFAFRYSPGSF